MKCYSWFSFGKKYNDFSEVLFCACILFSGRARALSLSVSLSAEFYVAVPFPPLPPMFTTSFGHLDPLFYCVHDVAAFLIHVLSGQRYLSTVGDDTVHQCWKCLYFYVLATGEEKTPCRTRHCISVLGL